MAKAAQQPKAILDYVNVVRNIRISSYPTREFVICADYIYPPLLITLVTVI